MVVGDKLEIYRHPVLLAVGVVDPIVVLCHVIDNVYRVLYALEPRFGFYCGLLFFYGQLSPIVADAPHGSVTECCHGCIRNDNETVVF